MKNFDRLWAPWRAPYITKVHQKTKGCLFCRLIKEKKDKKNFIFLRSAHSFAVLNLYPYNNGHILIVPYRHIKTLSQLKKMEREDLWNTLDKVTDLLDKCLKPAGYNIGLNVGRSAGAGFPGHLHIHIVPRWTGDANFMPVLAQTKVISQSLKSLYDLLTHALKT